MALLLVWQGVPQIFMDYVQGKTLPGLMGLVQTASDIAPFVFVQGLAGDLPAEQDQFRGLVEFEEATGVPGHVDQDVRWIAGDLVLCQ